MGNICSSGQRKHKDDISENSRESISYQLAEKNELTKIDSSMVEQKEEQKPKVSCPINVLTAQKECDSTSTEKNSKNSPGLFDLLSQSNNLSVLQGKHNLYKDEKIKKIIIYIASVNNHESEKAKQILYNTYDNLSSKCKIKGFEILFSGIHSLKYSNGATCFHNNIMEGQKQISNSLSELHRHLKSAYVIPIILLGVQVGCLLLPHRITSHHFESLLLSASKEERQLLENYYRVNEISQPKFYLLQISQFELDSEICYETNYLLVTLLKLFPDDMKDHYIKTLLEEEFKHAFLKIPEVAQRCIYVETEIQTILDGVFSLLHRECKRRVVNIQNNLKAYISEKNILRYLSTNHVSDEEFAAALQSSLEKSIEVIFEEHYTKYPLPGNTLGVETNLFLELKSLSFYTKNFSNNMKHSEMLEKIKRYINGLDSYPLIIKCKSDIERRTLVSNIVENIHFWQPKCYLIFRCARFSVVSMNISAILRSIFYQITSLINEEISFFYHSTENYGKAIKKLITLSTSLLVIIIDSVDELLGIDNFDWLPIIPNCTTKILLTVTNGENNDDNWAVQQLKKMIPDNNFLTPAHCSNIKTVNSAKYDLASQHGPQDYWENSEEKSPLYLNCTWRSAWLSDDDLSDLNRANILDEIIFFFESELNSTHFELFLLIIITSLWGILESDCIAIFQEHFQLDQDICLRIWSKFCWLMGPMLIHSHNIRIVDKMFRNIVLKRYKKKSMEISTILKIYFENQPDYITDPANNIKIYNHTKFANLPYFVLMEFKGNSSSNFEPEAFFLTQYFSDINWLSKKLIATCCIHILIDIELAENELNIDTSSIAHIGLLKKFLKHHVCEINYDGHQFFSLFKLFFKTESNKFVTFNVDKCINSWKDFITNYKMPYLEIMRNISTETDSSKDSKIYDFLVNIPTNGYFIASISTQRQEICVWDVPNCKRVRVLNGIPDPTAMCAIDTFDAAVLCKREIKIINMDEGKFKNTLKGVMNQNMPYFGLHDKKHLVCLSRNRMYVNLMDLESGDCVTTFKAGEDRFLNSLLVSGDGRILVCGDETQKPFPLLVWHLTQRKLLYDFRIPYHEFLTALSAITHEGSYVCVAAKELNEPTPNFIVVYDLQSGTLFKKWKPGCNTVALAISQENTCVVAGLEDAQVIIWDLVTGNIRSILTGHNAAVTLLKIDPLGKILLSSNKEGRDRSIRVWELNTGNLLSVYTPPSQITACEILPNGAFIVLALKNCSDIITLALKNYTDGPELNTVSIFGNPENSNKIFFLNDSNQ